ncbi:MAG: ABC transporter permease [Gemmatimonadota bacterium]
MDVEWRVVTPSFFETLGIEIVRGRAFTEAEDRADGPHVVVITERLAQRFWPDQDPVGRTLEYWTVRRRSSVWRQTCGTPT